ncbi:hypothetical protein BC936DRAFT_138037, partial [Jimgerdemannia flammicorona]
PFARQHGHHRLLPFCSKLQHNNPPGVADPRVVRPTLLPVLHSRNPSRPVPPVLVDCQAVQVGGELEVDGEALERHRGRINVRVCGVHVWRLLKNTKAVAFYIALFGFGLIAELPAAKQSLPSIKSWPVGMWIIFLVAIALILAFAVYHILYAVRLGGYFWIYYVCALLIPAFLLTCAILLWQEVDKNLVRTYLAKRKSQPKPKQSEQPEAGPTPTTEEAATEAAVPNPYTMKIGFHPHHWQIFYMLAFWTRFNDPVSQVAAGIVMGCYMQGVVAYGYDSILMDG